MPSDITSGRLRMFRLLVEEARGDRLAIDALLAVIAGDDLPAAIERLEEVRENIPPRKEGRKRGNHTWNDLVERITEMLDTALDDLRKLAERETNKEAAAR